MLLSWNLPAGTSKLTMNIDKVPKPIAGSCVLGNEIIGISWTIGKMAEILAAKKLTVRNFLSLFTAIGQVMGGWSSEELTL